MVPPHDKLVSATIFSKLLSTFVESRVTSFVQLHATPPVCCHVTLHWFSLWYKFNACSRSPHNVLHSPSISSLTLCTRKSFTRHRLLTWKLNLLVWGQSAKRCQASSLVPRPHPKLGKGAWCYLQIFPYVLCQQSSFGVEESCSSITNY